MNILTNIENILDSLNIEYEMQQYSGNADEYIIYDIFGEKDTDICDNENLSVNYSVTLNFWHKNKSSRTKYEAIKKLFKKNGFFFEDAKSLIDPNQRLIGKNFIFIKNILESED